MICLVIAIPSHFESSGISGILCRISGNSGIFSGISFHPINLFQNTIYHFILRRNLLSSLLQETASPPNRALLVVATEQAIEPTFKMLRDQISFDLK